jgi:diguanylate cyclase (GGDEF)-like protein/PAS domain S-box-containing protein
MLAAMVDSTSYAFNACAVPTLVTACAMFVLAVIVRARERGSREARHFTLLAATICIWLVCFSLMYLAKQERVALAWARAAYLGIAFIPAALFHFVVVVTRSWRRRRMAWAGWAIAALFFAAIAGSDALVGDLYRYWWGFYPRFRWLGAPFLVFFFIMLGLSLRELWSDYRRASPAPAHGLRTRWLMIGFAIAYLGSFDYVAAYGVALYPFGYLPVLAFIIIAAETIWRYRLVDLTPAFAAEQILATVADPVIVCDSDGRIRFTNDAAATVFGYAQGELAGAPIELLAEPQAGIAERLRAASGGVVRDEEMVFRTREGERVDVGVSLSPLVDDRRLTVGAVLIARDFRARKRAEAAARESEERYRTLFQRNQAGVFRTSIAGVILDCNDAFARILGFGARGECIGKSMLHHYHDLWQRTALLQKIRASGALTDEEIALKRVDGSPAWILANSLLIAKDGEPESLEGTVIDITQRKNAERQIVYQAYHDALTGLPNRMLLYDRLSQALSLARRDDLGVAVLFLDLDQFKLVNDTLGHAAGDRLLIEIARRLQQSVRASDTVARVGGDEFTLLLRNVEEGADAARMAQKVLEAIARPIEIEGQRLYLTTSIGISLFPADGEQAEALLTGADIAMYRAKELGRNGFQMCTPAMNAKSVARLTLERDLRLALERGELSLLYQPQIRVASGLTVGVEALLRWNHPQRGLVAPSEFIAVAEETRLILPIGEWVLRTACEQAKRWHLDSCPDLRVAVNLSALQFQQRGLVDVVHAILVETGVDPGRLVLEITESAAMQDADLTVEVLEMLRAMGLRIAIDDFGTGHASLSYLRQFPIDALKIDRAFVSDLEIRREGSAIINAIIGLAHGLDLEVIAEGVETAGQLRLLADRGCDEYQGYLSTVPLDAPDVPEFVGRLRPGLAATVA